MSSALQQTVAANLARVREAIASAAQRAGRNPDDIRLIAVSKTQPPEAVAAAIAAGQRLFGENTVQDALTKIPQFAGQNLEWHFIGHLQTNKVKFIPRNFSWLHSLDGLKLAERLSRMAQDHGVTIQTLIEVNITSDPAKHGVQSEAVPALLEQLLREPLPGIALRGLMTIGPQNGTEHELRTAFAALRSLRDQCTTRFSLPAFTELSMGMSNDFAEAIQEGATHVRVGTSIFGHRPHTLNR
jgi:hypothetical protein